MQSKITICAAGGILLISGLIFWLVHQSIARTNLDPKMRTVTEEHIEVKEFLDQNIPLDWGKIISVNHVHNVTYFYLQGKIHLRVVVAEVSDSGFTIKKVFKIRRTGA